MNPVTVGPSSALQQAALTWRHTCVPCAYRLAAGGSGCMALPALGRPRYTPPPIAGHLPFIQTPAHCYSSFLCVKIPRSLEYACSCTCTCKLTHPLVLLVCLGWLSPLAWSCHPGRHRHGVDFVIALASVTHRRRSQEEEEAEADCSSREGRARGPNRRC